LNQHVKLHCLFCLFQTDSDPLADHLTLTYLSELANTGVWADAVAVQGMARLLGRDIVIVNSMESSVSNDSYLKTTVQCENGGTNMLFKVPLCLGHVGELHYVSLIPSSESSKVTHEYSKELDPSTLDVPAPVLSDTCSSVMLNDIGYAVDNRCRLTAAEKLHFLQNPWTPAGDFKWPFTERMDHGKIWKKYLGKQHIIGVNHVFTYSTAKAGLFCTVCVLFASDTDVMQRKIVSEVQNAQFFTLLADETTDFSKQEQLSVCLRYVTKT